MCPGKKKQRLEESHFLITLNGVLLERDKLDRFLESDYFPLVRKTKKGEHEINARSFVKHMDLISNNRIRLVFKHASGPAPKPIDIVKNVFSLSDCQWDDTRILKTKQILS
jgi:hypothetical protein